MASDGTFTPESAETNLSEQMNLPSAGEFTQLALWMVGSVAGLQTARHASLAKHFRTLGRRVGWSVSTKRRQAARREVDRTLLLGEALMGVSRSALNSVFGEPPCGLSANRMIVRGSAVWDADVWYYPLTQSTAAAVAVEFDPADQVGRVVFMSPDA